MSTRGRVLLVPDRTDVFGRLGPALRQHGFEAISPAQWSGRDDDLDAVVVGPSPREGEPIAVCRTFATRSEVPVLLLADGTPRVAELLDAATRAGAFAVVATDPDSAGLYLTLDRAAEHSALRREVERLELAMQTSRGFDELLGDSAPMRRLYDVLDRAAQSDVPVLLTGESGTGKEMVARALHRRGHHAAGPFVPVNLAAVPDGLLESELFGHARGAFTDARSARKGLFVQASGGTLFLDEVGELSLALQPKLLRALQERTVRPVGSDQEVPFDARIVAATNRDLEAMVEEGLFRQDLFFRLAVIQVELPPLRERGADVLTLARHFLDRAAARSGKPIRRLDPAASQVLLRYPWPGNVRELENVVERAVALTRAETIGVEDLPDRLRAEAEASTTGPLGPALAAAPLAAPEPGDELLPLALVEQRHVRRVLARLGGNKTQAARVLGLDRKTLYRKLQSWGDLPPD